jgi:predicted nucleic acid-binding protein
VLRAVADSDDLVIEGRTVVAAALSTIAAQGVDFVDAYLAETARKDGSSVASFDHDFDRLGVEHIKPGT